MARISSDMKRRPTVLLIFAGLCALTQCQRSYHLTETGLPWSKARLHCRERYADLATVNDVEEMNLLVNAAQDTTGGITQAAWIGLHDNLTRWTWSDGQGYEGSAYWNRGQPNNFLGVELCVRMEWLGGWDDAPCSQIFPFICQNGMLDGDQTLSLVQEQLSWFDAQEYCRDIHSDLVTIKSEEQYEQALSLVEKGSVWIGLSRRREWSDGSDSTYRNWKEGQPDNLGQLQNCVAADLGNAGLWTDENCDEELPFICYGTRTVIQVTPTPMSTSLTTSDGGATEQTSTLQAALTTSVSAIIQVTPTPMSTSLTTGDGGATEPTSALKAASTTSVSAVIQVTPTAMSTSLTTSDGGTTEQTSALQAASTTSVSVVIQVTPTPMSTSLTTGGGGATEQTSTLQAASTTSVSAVIQVTPTPMSTSLTTGSGGATEPTSALQAASTTSVSAVIQVTPTPMSTSLTTDGGGATEPTSALQAASTTSVSAVIQVTPTPMSTSLTTGGGGATEQTSALQAASTTSVSVLSELIFLMDLSAALSVELSEDEMADLVSEQIHYLLMELGLPQSMKVHVRAQE